MNTKLDDSFEYRPSNSLKWEFHYDRGRLEHWQQCDPAQGENRVLPMWVADMDFKAAPAVRAAIEGRVAHGLFGYSLPTPDYFEAVRHWMAHRHNWQIETDWILPSPGVVPGLNFIVKRFTQPGDGVLVQPPVYYPFYTAASNNGRVAVHNPLTYDGRRYHMDFDQLERCLAEKNVKLAILCSPHNPVGRIWSEAELVRFASLCREHGVMVVADEIHHDLIHPDHSFTPFGRLEQEFRENAIICTAVSKSFNLAGLATANLIIQNPELREELRSEILSAGIFPMNPFGIVATQAAYNDSEDWLDSAIAYIDDNFRYLEAFLDQHLPDISVASAEATYLAWLDFRATGLDHHELSRVLAGDCRLFLDDGQKFGKQGEGFMRMNLACSRRTLETALQRLADAFSNR